MDRERGIETPEQKPVDKATERQKLFARALSGSAADIAAYRNEFTGDYVLGTGATAGYLSAPTQFVEDLIKGLDDNLFIRNIAHKTPTLGAAQSLGFPYRATAAADADWKTEVAAAAVEDDLTYGLREFSQDKYPNAFRTSLKDYYPDGIKTPSARKSPTSGRSAARATASARRSTRAGSR